MTLSDQQKLLLCEVAKQYIRRTRITSANKLRLKYIRLVLQVIQSPTERENLDDLYWDLHDLFPVFYYTAIRKVAIRTPKDILELPKRLTTNKIDLALDCTKCSPKDWEECSTDEIIEAVSRTQDPRIRQLTFVSFLRPLPPNLIDFLAAIKCRRMEITIKDDHWRSDSLSDQSDSEHPRKYEILEVIFKNPAVEVF
jgi:hypothetical protein